MIGDQMFALAVPQAATLQRLPECLPAGSLTSLRIPHFALKQLNCHLTHPTRTSSRPEQTQVPRKLNGAADHTALDAARPLAMQQVQQILEQQLLRAAQQVEDQIDNELHKMEKMDDDDIERLRQKRVEELKR